MFDILLTCKVNELKQKAEQISASLKPDEVEPFIRALWTRVPELTVVQEKELHKLGRKILKRFSMNPFRLKGSINNIIKTERLILRPLTLADAETAYHGWTGDPYPSRNRR